MKLNIILNILKINDGLSKRRSYYLYFYTILLKMNLFRKINSGLFFYKKKFEQCLEEKKTGSWHWQWGFKNSVTFFLCKKTDLLDFTTTKMASVTGPTRITDTISTGSITKSVRCTWFWTWKCWQWRSCGHTHFWGSLLHFEHILIWRPHNG